MNRFSRHFKVEVQIQAELTARDIGCLRHPSRTSFMAMDVDKHIRLLLSRPSGTIGIDSQETQCSLANWISQY